MNQQSSLATLFCVILAVLIVSSLIAWIGRRRRPTPLWSNVWERVVGWWILCSILACAVFAGRIPTIVLFFLCSVVALREFVSLVPTARVDHRLLVWTYYAVIPAQYILLGVEWYGLFAIFIPVYSFSGHA